MNLLKDCKKENNLLQAISSLADEINNAKLEGLDLTHKLLSY